MSQPYCSIDDVEAHTGRGYDSDSKPSRVRVQKILIEVAREIDAVLEGAGYTLPVAAAQTNALEYLKALNTLGAAYRSWYAGERGTTTFPAVESWRSDYKDNITGLMAGKMSLPGLDPDNGGSEKFIGIIRSISLTD